jgi:prolipoprotein diacylglyceryl transferase
MVWNVDPVFLRLGTLEIRYYGLFFVMALLGGFYWWRWQILRSGRSEADAEGLLLPAVAAVILGARLGHVIFYEPGRFLSNPLEIVMVWRGGLASHGAAVGIILTLLWYAKRHRMAFLEVADRFSFSIAWGAMMVRLGNFMNSEIVGRPTTVPWGVKFQRFDWNLPLAEVPLRHPSQIYEFLIAAAALAVLLLLDRRWGEKRPRGALIFLFLIIYFGGRFLVEFFKAFEGLNPDTNVLTMGQYLSMPFVALGVGGLWMSLRKKPAK